MRSRFFLGLLIAVAVPVLAGVAAAEPRRVVSLAPSITETVFALGMGDRLVGVSTYCDYPEPAKAIAKVGTFLAPNIEAIAAARPDLVLAVPSPGNRSSVESMQQLGFEVVVVEPDESLASIEASFATIGRALGREAEAVRLVQNLRAQIATVRGRLQDLPKRKVLMVVGQSPLIAAGGRTVQDELITLAEGINLGARGGSGWPHLSLEFAIASRPEVIIDSTMGNEERAGAGAALKFWSAFPTIPAVKNGRVVGFQAYELLRPGPRIGTAFEHIARFIHPERFGQP